MYTQKLICMYCCLVFVLPSFAGHPGGKFYGNHNRKLSKKDLHVGPNRNQLRRQGAWEMLLAKKALKSHLHETAGTTVVQKLPFANVPAMNLPITRERQHYAPSLKLRFAHPIQTIILFTLLIAAPYASACRASCDALSKSRQHYPEATVANLWQCCYAREFIEQHQSDYKAIIELANQYKDKISGIVSPEISFPTIPDLDCPAPECKHRGWDDRDTLQDHSEGERARKFFEQFEGNWAWLKLLIKGYDEHLEAASACEELVGLITEQRAQFDEIRADAQANKDRLGGEVIFPTTPEIQCPSMKNWPKWVVQEAEASTQTAKTFLQAFNQKIEEFNKLIDQHDASSACEKSVRLITEQRAYFDEIRAAAQANKELLGSEVIFPATPEIQCPSMKNWQQWNIQEAEASTQTAKTFLQAFNQKIEEFNKLVDEYNTRLEQGEHTTGL